MNLTNKIEVFNCDNMELMAKYPDNYFDLAIVDPEYGIGADIKNSKRELKTKKSATLSKKYGSQRWDSKYPNIKYFYELFRISKNQIIWGVNYYPYDLFSGGRIVWDKKVTMPTYSDGEIAYNSNTNKVDIYEYTWHGMIQQNMKNKEVRIHPTQKPVKLYQWLLEKYAKPDFKVFDSHLGSGSHAIAAHYFGCEFVGCEIDKDYFNDFLNRFKHETAQLKMF